MSQSQTAEPAILDGKGSPVVIERILDAHRELVWRAWTDPEYLMRWWGPKDYTSPVCKMDLRVGGKYVFCMRQADGQDFWSTGVYQAIVPMERIAFTDSFADPDGNVVSGAYYGMGEDFPLELQAVVTFEELGNKTRMTLRHYGMPEGIIKEMSEQGWGQSFDKLAVSLR